MFWISVAHLPYNGFTEILTTALCLTDNESDTADGLFRTRIQGKEFLRAQHQNVLKGFDFYDSGWYRRCQEQA